jgi:hypothetical protein
VDGGTSGKFVEAVAEAGEYAGDIVQFQFYFNSTDGMFNETEGVYVDDFRVNSKCGGPTGEEVTTQTFPTLWDVWGTGSDDVFAVGNGGAIIHWDGNTWTQKSGGATKDFFGLGGNEDFLMVVGEEGECLASFEGGLDAQDVPTSAQLNDVVSLVGNEAIAVGEMGTILRHGTQGWVTENSGVFTTLRGVWSDGASVVAVGDGGSTLHRVGNSWQSKPSQTPGDLFGIWGFDSKNIYAVGEKGVVVKYDGTSWSKKGDMLKDSNGAVLHSIIGFGAEGPFIAVGTSGDSVVNLDGVWKKADNKVNTNELHSVWGAVPEAVWAVGNLGTINKWDGSKWEAISSPTDLNLYAVWGRSQEEVYAAGQYGVLLNWDGISWKIVRSSTSQNLRAVWGLGPNNVYAVGQYATIMHYDGLNWSQIKIEDQVVAGGLQPVTDQLFDIWGTASNDIWAIGAKGTLIHTNIDTETGEMTWVKIPHDDTEITLRGLWGKDKEHFWMAGLEGAVFRSNGQYLKAEKTGSIATLYDIQGFSNGDIVAVGDLGTVLRYVYEAP